MVDVVARQYVMEACIAKPPVSENILAFFDPARPVIISKAALGTKRAVLDLYHGEWLVIVNEKDHPYTQRFSALHEGWHILEQAHPQLRLYMRQTAVHEWAADRFAGATLMPEHWVGEQWRRNLCVRSLAALFKVTSAAMRTRLKVLGYI